MIACPFHKELGETVEADHIATYDQTVDENGFGPVEMYRFQCREDPTHVWEHPSQNFWLWQSVAGAKWQQFRDKIRR